MRHAGLFSGIGGFSLAAEWMGWRNVFEVEIDPFCRQVLHKNFPHSQLFEDVCLFDATPFRGLIDVLSGGFPCQPFSVAGRKLGAADSRALWPQMLRIIREIQPRFVVGENVRGLLGNNGGLAFEAVCAELEAAGYDVQPFLLPACAVGAVHRRDRFWFVAHATGQRREELFAISRGATQFSECSDLRLLNRTATHASGAGWEAQCAYSKGTEPCGGRERDAAPAHGVGRLTEPPLCGPNDGLSARLVRTASPRSKQLKAYGNAIVPQVAYQIFQAIEAVEALAHA